MEKPGSRLALEPLGGVASCRERFSDPVDLEVLSVSCFVVLWSKDALVEDAAIEGIDE
jgi:hypothetical protein